MESRGALPQTARQLHLILPEHSDTQTNETTCYFHLESKSGQFERHCSIYCKIVMQQMTEQALEDPADSNHIHKEIYRKCSSLSTDYLSYI